MQGRGFTQAPPSAGQPQGGEGVREEKRPLWGKCVECAHCWPVAYLPIDVATLGKIANGGFVCPMCGGAKPVVAKQDNGVLQEPVA